MGEDPRKREIVERMAARVKEHNARGGREVSAAQAKQQVAEVARRRDAQKADGAGKNDRKREQPQQGERRVAKGGIFIDLGKKG